MKDLLSFMLQQLLEHERDKQIGVDKYERDESERKVFTNGYKIRVLNTRFDNINLRKFHINLLYLSFKALQEDKKHKSNIIS